MELSDFYLKKIFTLSFFITSDLNVSKILTKRIFIRTWEDLKTFDNNIFFADWLLDLAIQLIYDELKTKYISAYLVDNKDKTEPISITENLTTVEKAILDLPQEERFIFILHDIEKYSLDKISALTENKDIEKQGAQLFNLRDSILTALNILDEENQFKLLGRYNEILAAQNSDEQSAKLESLFLSKEKHYEVIYFFTTLNSFQPNITLPEDIRESIFNELFQQGLEEKTKHRREEELKQMAKQKVHKEDKTPKEKKEKIQKIKPPKAPGAEKKPLNFKLPKIANKKVFVFIFFTAIIISIAYYYTYFQTNTPWNVEVVKGRYRITNGSDASQLYEKQTLITDLESEALVKITEVGQIQLKEYSELTLNIGTKELSEVTLNKGTIEISTGSVKSGIVTNCGNTQIIDLGSISTISFRPPGDNTVKVMRGLVEVRAGNDFVYLIGNHISETKLGSKPGIPYAATAAPELIDELKNLQYQNGGFESLTKIINAATERDAVTLWHLFPRVELTERELLYDKITEFFPLPQGIEKRQIMNLDQVKLKEWFDSIKWQL
ncbi:MAG: hypothetical protein A2068_14965 [Ignavibacteria bacterium GWB2_35_6b]|nr:MAG: hypothetical protein A2068_14965 [Ignavibacteria bacterium GWB2_35_6b]